VKPTPEQEQAQNRIHDLLAGLVDLIGPNLGGQADAEVDPEDMPQGAVFLGEWVAVLHWVDETGQSFTTRIESANLLAHHRVGLLHEGLYGFGG